MRRLRVHPLALLREVVVIGVAGLWWLPFYILGSTSLKTNAGAESQTGLSLPSSVSTSSFPQAWAGSGTGTLGHALVGSLIITVGSVIGIVVLGSLAGYTIARRGGRLGSGLYTLFALGLILPFQLALIPIYTVFRHLGLVGDYLGLIVLYTGILTPLSVFLYSGFVRALPRDYEEAAVVDGAQRARVFFRVVLPLLRPVTGTVVILASLLIWNDFFTQLVFLSGSSDTTLPVAVYSFVGEFSAQWNLVFAAVIVSMAPVMIFFVFAQRQLIKGFTGGIKA